MNEFTLSAFILALVYVVIITILFGVLKSISDSYFKVGHWFTVWCFSMAILLFLGLYQIRPEVFFTSFGFVVVGLACKINENYQKPAHYIGAMIIILSGFLIVTLINTYLGLILTGIMAIITGYMAYKKVENRIYWLENIAFALIFFGIFFNDFLLMFSLLLNQIICS
jgi:hypothetical protein